MAESGSMPVFVKGVILPGQSKYGGDIGAYDDSQSEILYIKKTRSLHGI